MKKLLLLFTAFLVLFLTAESFFNFTHLRGASQYFLSLAQPKNIYAEFVGEIYDIISQNYWEEIKDDELSNLFLTSSRQLAPSKVLASQNKEGVKRLINEITKDMEPQKKKEFAVNLSDLTLAS
ncbi:MAG: hypothetical protein HYW64_02260, partial [Candidatus Levybacteria bacterium]|nr:hypothetical protein [Candidatus Levybacteria bacterium]